MKYNESGPWSLVSAIKIMFVGAMMSLAFRYLFTWIGLTGYGEAESLLLADKGIFVLAIELLLLSPVLEELFFRGVLYRLLKHRVSEKAAMLISAVMFGIYHWNIPQGIYAFVMGMVLVGVMERYATIKAPILLHMAANVAALTVCSITGAV